MAGFDLDSCLERLIKFRQGNKIELKEDEIKGICQAAKRIFLDQPVLLELNAPIRIVGDVHGQYNDLQRLFEFGGLPPQSNYLFLGDYVDRGKNGLETICLLLCYKVKYPENFFLLRGNHEASPINRIYGFHDECKRRYNVRVWKQFNEVFDCLPFSAIVEEKILCVHGACGRL